MQELLESPRVSQSSLPPKGDSQTSAERSKPPKNNFEANFGAKMNTVSSNEY